MTLFIDLYSIQSSTLALSSREFKPLLPSLTVLICCYSGEEFFDSTFESVASQIGLDFKVVIHDNGCSPSYRRKIDQAAARSGAQVIRTDVNRYGEGVRIDALPHIKTDYVATLHDDDLIGPGRLLNDMERISEYDFDFVFSDRYYIDKLGKPFLPESAEINSAPFDPGDFPYKFIAEIFYKGLRFHYSTLVMRTELAQRYVYGDPYLPRIADCLFVTRLLLDRSLRGIALDYKQTAIRIHGSNDMLYSKFEPDRREEEVYLLTQAELFIFDYLIREAELEQLVAIFAFFPGVHHSPGEDVPSLLVRVALELSKWGRSKKLMAARCVHEAFRLAPSRTVMSFRKWTDSDANSFMVNLYGDYAREELAVARQLSESAHPAAIELAKLKTSSFWKISAPLRKLHPIGYEILSQKFPRQPPLYILGTKLDLSRPEADPYLPSGFAGAEPWGRWTDGFRAIIKLRYEQPIDDASLELTPIMIFKPTMENREIEVSVNGYGLVRCVPMADTPIILKVKKSVLSRSKTVTIVIDVPNPKGPDVEPLNDLRGIGVGFHSMTLTVLR